MGKLPSIQFYPGDWLRDPVAGCSLAAQGLWFRMLLAAHDSPRYGYLCNRNGSPLPLEIIASKCGCSLAQFQTLLAELDSVGVPSRTSAGTIYSRRMVRDEKRRAQWRKSKQISKKGVIPHDFHTDSTCSSSSSSNLNTKTPLPPASGGKKNLAYFEKRDGVIEIEIGKHRRLPSLELCAGMRAEEAAEFLTRQGFPAKVLESA